MASKKTPSINAASMADVSFIILIFFLVTTTMGTDFGLMRQLPPMQESPTEKHEKINERNVFVVAVSQKNDLLVENKYTDISQLKEMTKDFFDIKNTSASHPEKEVKELPFFGNVSINKGAVVSLQNDRGTSYKTYIQVQNELAAAINELRNEISLQKFGKKFDDLSEDEQDVIGKRIYPMSISEAEPKNIGDKK